MRSCKSQPSRLQNSNPEISKIAFEISGVSPGCLGIRPFPLSIDGSSRPRQRPVWGNQSTQLTRKTASPDGHQCFIWQDKSVLIYSRRTARFPKWLFGVRPPGTVVWAPDRAINHDVTYHGSDFLFVMKASCPQDTFFLQE